MKSLLMVLLVAVSGCMVQVEDSVSPYEEDDSSAETAYVGHKGSADPSCENVLCPDMFVCSEGFCVSDARSACGEGCLDPSQMILLVNPMHENAKNSR